MFRRLLLAALTALISYALIEGFSFVAYRVAVHEWMSLSQLQAERLALQEEMSPVIDNERQALGLKYIPHPYLGYALNPKISRLTENWWIDSEGSPIPPKPNVFYAVMTGGSVAYNLSRSAEAFERELRKFGVIGDRKISWVNLAGLGYKQPQQLIAVNYFLALGGRIDVLMNLDGFNEVGSSIDMNVDAGIYPHYPPFWPAVTRDWKQPEALERFFEVKQLRKQRVKLANTFGRFGYSVSANLIWKLLDSSSASRIHTISKDDRVGDDLPKHSRGPKYRVPSGSDAELQAREDAVALWARSSRLMQAVSREHGFPYLHLLQPNQYVPDSRKMFDSVELSLRLDNEHYKKTIPIWYPKLQALGESLRQDGIAFIDLTRIYYDIKEVVYYDNCCHFTPFARDLLATEVARQVGKAIENQR